MSTETERRRISRRLRRQIAVVLLLLAVALWIAAIWTGDGLLGGTGAMVCLVGIGFAVSTVPWEEMD